jgi:hypothetical protein
MANKTFDKIFRDKDGNVVIAQFTNAVILITFGLFIASRLFDDSIKPYFSAVVSFFLIYWAYLEIFKGVNLWRKFLGLVVGGWSVYRIIELFFL